MAGIKRKAKAAFEIILFTFMFTVLEKRGMIPGKDRKVEGEELGVD